MSAGDRIYTSARFIDARHNLPGEPFTDDPFSVGYQGAAFATQWDGNLVIAQTYPIERRSIGTNRAWSTFTINNTSEQTIAAGWWDEPGNPSGFDILTARFAFVAGGGRTSAARVRARFVVRDTTGALTDLGPTTETLAVHEAPQGSIGLIELGQSGYAFTRTESLIRYMTCEVVMANTLGLGKLVEVRGYATEEDDNSAAREIRPLWCNVYVMQRF